MFLNRMTVIPVVIYKSQFDIAIADPIIAVLTFEFQQHCYLSNFSFVFLRTIQIKLTII